MGTTPGSIKVKVIRPDWAGSRIFDLSSNAGYGAFVRKMGLLHFSFPTRTSWHIHNLLRCGCREINIDGVVFRRVE